MQRPAFWLMSNPLANPQFRRGWTVPPPLNRKRRPGANGAAHFESNLSTGDYVAEGHQHAAELRKLVRRPWSLPRITAPAGEAIHAA